MQEAKLQVELLTMTENALDAVYAACRQCYSTGFAADIFSGSVKGERSLAEKESFVRKIVESGHESPLEHVSLTYAVRGISRSCSLQLVRHRIASYSQQSQRYVSMEDFGYIIPPTISDDPELKHLFVDAMDGIQKKYNSIVKALNTKGIEGESARQDARFILPEASETKIVITMNARELLHFFSQRCCARAQWEIRRMANKMLEIAKAVLPPIFGKESGAKCERLRYCPEGASLTCGRYPVKHEVMEQ
jgi:thymidylate synthase (FAD)